MLVDIILIPCPPPLDRFLMNVLKIYRRRFYEFMPMEIVRKKVWAFYFILLYQCIYIVVRYNLFFFVEWGFELADCINLHTF